MRLSGRDVWFRAMARRAVGAHPRVRPRCAAWRAMQASAARSGRQCRSLPSMRAHTQVRPYGIVTPCSAIAECYVAPRLSKTLDKARVVVYTTLPLVEADGEGVKPPSPSLPLLACTIAMRKAWLSPSTLETDNRICGVVDETSSLV
jgi:hypothetical protein